MGWELIGGDPAPGSPESVRTAATALKSVAELAGEVLQSLTQETGEVGVERWKGTAADTFRQDIAHLPDSLRDVERSYDEASKALISYEGTLERAQYDARAALTAATQAAADRDQAKSRRDSAQHNADALRSQRRSAGVRLESLRLQQSVSLDPVHRSSLDSPIASTRSQVSRLDADVADADHAVARQTAAINEAEDRLRRASGQADAIRHEISDAVDRAVAALKQAERDAHLPSWLQRTEADLKQDWKTYSPVLAESVHKLEADAKNWLQTYGPEVINLLDDAQMVFAIAAMIPTPLSPFLAGAALACGATALILSAAKDATQPGGITTKDWLDLGVRTLSVASDGVLLKAGKVAKTAEEAARVTNSARKAATIGEEASKGWRTASTVLSYGSDATGIVKNAEENGGSPEAFVYATAGYVIGKGATTGLTKGIQKLEGVPAVRNHINSMTETLNKDVHVSGSGTDLHVGLKNPHPGPMARPSTAAVEKTTEDVIDKGGDKPRDWIQEKVSGMTPSQPDVHFDLDPSPYGGVA